MNRSWLITILGLSFALLALLKTHEVNSLHSYVKGEPSLKLGNFAEARKHLDPKDLDLLKLWESILTGRSAPLSQQTKEIYQDLGLKHVFTPSGFHLTAVLSPFLKISSSIKFHLGLLLTLGLFLAFLPGLGALKRMVIIKGAQKVFGIPIGFIFALFLDTLFGTFQDAPLSFAYSFLFLGIIYSGLSGLGLAFWFFTGQIIISHFQATLISPLLILWSPVLNLVFALAMPFLFVLALPLWNWQIKTGLFLLEWIQKLIVLASSTLAWLPFWEIHTGTLLAVICFVLRKHKCFLLVVLIMSNSLNMDLEKIPGGPSNEFCPQGKLLVVRNEVAHYTDVKCQFKLIKGHIWEKCRQKKSSSRRRSFKKI